MPDSALPPNLRGKRHTDWVWPFSLVPRGWTAFNWGPPRMLLGNVQAADMVHGAPKPITSPRTWQVSYYRYAPWWAKLTGLAFYAAFSGARKADGMFRHYRGGTRWDDVDDYGTILAFATRRFTGRDDQDTSTL
jgi:hypothetical protein